MLSNNNAAPLLPSVPSKHNLAVQYYISRRLESGEKKAPDVTSTNFWNKGVWQEGKEMKFSNGLSENAGMDRGVCTVGLLEWTFNAALSQAISILNIPFHLIL